MLKWQNIHGVEPSQRITFSTCFEAATDVVIVQVSRAAGARPVIQFTTGPIRPGSSSVASRRRMGNLSNKPEIPLISRAGRRSKWESDNGVARVPTRNSHARPNGANAELVSDVTGAAIGASVERRQTERVLVAWVYVLHSMPFLCLDACHPSVLTVDPLAGCAE